MGRKKNDIRTTPTGRELSTDAPRFQDALWCVRRLRGLDDGPAARAQASFIVIRDALTAAGHIACEQDGSVECPRCSRSGGHHIDTARKVLVMAGRVFTERCA